MAGENPNLRESDSIFSVGVAVVLLVIFFGICENLARKIPKKNNGICVSEQFRVSKHWDLLCQHCLLTPPVLLFAHGIPRYFSPRGMIDLIDCEHQRRGS